MPTVFKKKKPITDVFNQRLIVLESDWFCIKPLALILYTDAGDMPHRLKLLLFIKKNEKPKNNTLSKQF